MSDASPRWDDDPPPETGKYIPIVRAKNKASLQLICLSHHCQGVWVHSIDKKDFPCTGKEAGCYHCERRRATRWKGYLGAWLERFSRLVLVEVTIDARRHCRLDIGRDGPDLRGRFITLQRLGDAENGPVRLDFTEATADEASIPAPFDERAALMRIWGISPPAR